MLHPWPAVCAGSGDTQLEKGDRLTVLISADDAATLVESIGLPPAPSPTGPAGVAATEDAVIETIRAQLPSRSLVLEPEVTTPSRVEGVLVRDLNLGHGVLVVAIRRGDALIVPKGDTRLAAGDRLTIVSPADQADAVLGLFNAEAQDR
jgi:potassium/hydrogen antiporter